ncbi:hypothetical protein BDK51DRAFT_32044 [Blyttiomyces helicus]|uniref:Uncharacterized protein n=1 Tax=Blyttiomyces helicus TaxID=388810 RepID=A0A4P9WTX3_9FUNG|nr:hypothetical protein BDK51DRAFT_32044 [Blyttiomyces helicus]|eukprot:RKO94820.1 hypothetical protein BDK51DRAFT_32044 [Blyttiomyces helicus]
MMQINTNWFLKWWRLAKLDSVIQFIPVVLQDLVQVCSSSSPHPQIGSVSRSLNAIGQPMTFCGLTEYLAPIQKMLKMVHINTASKAEHHQMIEEFRLPISGVSPALPSSQTNSQLYPTWSLGPTLIPAATTPFRGGRFLYEVPSTCLLLMMEGYAKESLDREEASQAPTLPHQDASGH